jgi:hypothetical protein
MQGFYGGKIHKEVSEFFGGPKEPLISQIKRLDYTD